MTRGDLVTIALPGDFGKPIPALVIQADQFGEHATVTVLPVTSTLIAAPLFRITVQPITVTVYKMHRIRKRKGKRRITVRK